MNTEFVKIRTVKPASIAVRVKDDEVRENIPENEVVTVRKDIADDLVSCGIAVYLNSPKAK